MSTDKPSDKRISWLIAATFLNTALSLGALGLWFFAPNRNPAALPATNSSVTAPRFAARPPLPPQNRFPRRTFDQAGSGPTAPEGPTEALPPARMANQRIMKSGDVKTSPATMALAERLHLRPEILAQTFADDAGDVPRKVAQRLEQAYDAAASLAKRHNLDESQTQSITTLLTHYAFRISQEEKIAAPGPIDPKLVEALREEILNGVGMTCGDEIQKAAELVIDQQ